MKNQKKTNKSYVAAVLSGKGGVGKTMTSINVAVRLSESGYKTAVLDADLGLSNCAAFFNTEPMHTVTDWIGGKCGLENLPQLVNGVTLVTGSSDPSASNIGTEMMMDALDQVTDYLKQTHDFIIIDTPAGAGEMTLWSLDAADTGMLILVDEPAAISDVYRLSKYIYNIDPEYRFAGVVNFADSETSADSTFKRFNTILNYFLKKQIPYFGFIPASKNIKTAISEQRPLHAERGDDKEIKEIEFIAQQVVAASANQQKQQLTGSVN